MPDCDIKWEENKVGDLIIELRIDVALCGQSGHKSKIAQLHLGVEKAFQSIKIFAHVSFSRLASQFKLLDAHY